MQDLMLLVLILIIPIAAQGMITSSYNKYSKIKINKEISGQEVARMILDKNGLKDVYVVETTGHLSDHYDPKRKVVRLSKVIYEKDTIASVAVAAHEVGHAIQDKEGYFFMKIRSLIYPVVNLGTMFSYIIIMIGIFTQILDLIYLGIGLTALGLLFQLVTLPVEFDASKRAKEELNKLGLINQEEQNGVNKMLNSAAMTYVAGVLASALQILRLVLLFGGRND